MINHFDVVGGGWTVYMALSSDERVYICGYVDGYNSTLCNTTIFIDNKIYNEGYLDGKGDRELQSDSSHDII